MVALMVFAAGFYLLVQLVDVCPWCALGLLLSPLLGYGVLLLLAGLFS